MDIFNNIKFLNQSVFSKNIKYFFGSRIIDIFIHFPKGISYKNFKENIEDSDIGNLITLDICVEQHLKNFNKKIPYRIKCRTEKNQNIEILFFNMYSSFLEKKFKLGEKFRITGKLNFYSNTYQISHPQAALSNNNLDKFEENEPIYNLDRKKINKVLFRKLILNNLLFIKKGNFPKEWIEKKFLKKNWSSFKQSILNIHQLKKNSNLQTFNICRERLAFDEILASFLIFKNLKKKNQEKNFLIIQDNSKSNEILKELDFKLTKDQLSSLKEIQLDLKKKKRMYRLLQGDVGCGKTIVALLTILDVIKNGYQAVLMSPTELLAIQHYEYFSNIIKSSNFKIKLLTSKVKNKADIYNQIKNKEIDLLIGTHAVYNSSIHFNNLGIIVIDEQHKFGVNQRINLLEKSTTCHTLIMSATPIPRSLSFAIYGEIEISNIKTKPLGRKKVVTSIINNKKIGNLIEGIKRKINNCEQVFWILPEIGDNIKDKEKETLITRYNFLNKIFHNQTTIVHSRMTKEDIEKNMTEFHQKKKMILVATTLIEVGINIPSASLMIVEAADRFGLAQLHQLRGRISRSNLSSHCVLIHNNRLSENSRDRLLILKNYDNGFEIAEKDLLLRGSGDILGTNQSGLPNWRFFKPFEDFHLIEKVRKNCECLLSNKSKNKEKINFLINTFFKESHLKNYRSA